MNDLRFQQLLKYVENNIDNSDPAHDFTHILRVVENCKMLARDQNVNLSVLLPAALLHDVVNLPKDHSERAKASEFSAQKAHDILKQFNYDEKEITHIRSIILEHSYSSGNAPTSIESEILQDADRLDALGAIGLMRLITTGAKLHSLYYDIDDPFAKNRELDDRKYALDHLPVKLYKLAAIMNTEPAKQEALKRIAYMKAFIGQLKAEIN